MTETQLMHEIQIALSARGCAIWRNNRGAIARARRDGRQSYSQYGLLAEGASDLIGIAPDGRFLAVEVKLPGARSGRAHLSRQQAFVDLVRTRGGIAGIVSSITEALELVAQ